MSAWVDEITNSNGVVRYKGRWRLGRGKARSRTFDFAYQAREWAEEQEAEAMAAAADLAATREAAHIAVTGEQPPKRGRGRPSAEEVAARRPGAPATAWRKDASSQTLAEHAAEWLGRQHTLKDKGRTGYQTVIRFLGTWHAEDGRVPQPLGAYRLAELDPDLIADWIGDQLDAVTKKGAPRWSHRTINGRLALVRQMAQPALRNGKLRADPTEGIAKLPEKPKRPHRALSELEQAALLNAAEGEERIWLQLGMRAGLRWGEIFGLAADAVIRVPDPTNEGAWIVVVDVHQVNEGDGTIRDRSTKTGDDEDDFRQVPVPADFGEELWAYTEQVRATRGKHAILFVTETGAHPLWYRNFHRRAWVPLRARAGLARIQRPAPPQIHDLRHTWATAMARGGESGIPIPLRDLMALGGWRKIETAQKYQHASDIEDQAAMVGRVFGTGGKLRAVPAETATAAG